LDFGLKKSLSLAVAALWVSAGAGYAAYTAAPQSDTTTRGRINNCVECHKKETAEAVSLYSTSTHAGAAVACSRCHGGNQAAAEKQAAHAGRFTGIPDPAGVLAMCGSCHSAERDAFKSGRHFDASHNAPRIDCSQCHGAHAVGSAQREFSFASFCANCHGLEYLPELPASFRALMASVDEQAESLRAIKASGREPSEELLAKRREIRRAIADIVHRTDFEGGSRKIPQILKWVEDFKREAAKR
jgi:cytochrome c553